MRILVANIGSTSFKYRLLEMPQVAVLAQGRVERIGQAGGDCPDYDAAIARCRGEIVGEGRPLGSLSELSAVMVFVQVSPDGRPGEASATWLGSAGPLEPSLGAKPLEIMLAPRS